MDKDGAAFGRWMDRQFGMDDEAIIAAFEKRLQAFPGETSNYTDIPVYLVTRAELLKFAKYIIKKHKED